MLLWCHCSCKVFKLTKQKIQRLIREVVGYLALTMCQTDLMHPIPPVKELNFYTGN